MSVTGDSSKLVLIKISNYLVQFLALAYFSREIGGTALSVFFLFQALVELLDIPASFGLRDGVEKRLSEGADAGEFVAAGLLLKAVTLGLTLGVVYAFRGRINAYLGAPLVVPLVVALALYSTGRFFVKVLYGELRAGETAVIVFAQQLSWAAVSVALVYLGYGYRSLMYGLIVGFAVTLVWSLAKTDTPVVEPDLSHVRSVARFSAFSFLSSTSWNVYNWTDVVILGFFASSLHVSSYELSWRIAYIAIFVTNTIVLTAVPTISTWDAEGRRGEAESLLAEVSTLSLGIVVPAFFGTLVLAPEILTYAFGSEYAVASVPFVILIGAQVVQVFRLVYGHALRAIDYPDLYARGAVAGIVVNVLLNVLLVHFYGMVGAAVGTTTAFGVSALSHWLHLRRLMSVRIDWRKLGWTVLSSVVMASAIAAFRLYANIGSIVELLSVILLSVGVYSLCILWYEPLRSDVFTLMESMNIDVGK